MGKKARRNESKALARIRKEVQAVDQPNKDVPKLWQVRKMLQYGRDADVSFFFFMASFVTGFVGYVLFLVSIILLFSGGIGAAFMRTMEGMSFCASINLSCLYVRGVLKRREILRMPKMASETKNDSTLVTQWLSGEYKRLVARFNEICGRVEARLITDRDEAKVAVERGELLLQALRGEPPAENIADRIRRMSVLRDVVVSELDAYVKALEKLAEQKTAVQQALERKESVARKQLLARYGEFDYGRTVAALREKRIREVAEAEAEFETGLETLRDELKQLHERALPAIAEAAGAVLELGETDGSAREGIAALEGFLAESARLLETAPASIA